VSLRELGVEVTWPEAACECLRALEEALAGTGMRRETVLREAWRNLAGEAEPPRADEVVNEE